MTRFAAGVAAAVLLGWAPAHADDVKVDPAAAEAADANLESIEARRGMVFTAGFGGGFTLGIGIDDSTGTGGSAVFRIARVASRRALVGLELTGVAQFTKVNTATQMDPVLVSYRKDSLALLASGQYYVGPIFWFRLGVGVGRYVGEELRSEVGILLRDRTRLLALAGSAGAGLDLIRLKRFRAGVEIMSTGYVTRDGVLSANAFLAALTFD